MKNLSNRNIIILSSIDWDSHRHLHHELIDYLLEKKNNILFVENTGSRTVRITDFPRIKKRLSNFIKSSKGIKKNYKQNSRKDLNLFLKENAWKNKFKLLEKWSLIKEFENKYIDKKNFKLNKFKIYNFIFNSLILISALFVINYFFKLI